MKISIIGPLGSGKTTLAKSLSEQYNIPLIVMGDILRNPDMYEGVRDIIGDYNVHDGSLLSDEKLIQVCYVVLDHHPAGWIFDGVPRQIKQYNDMLKMFPPDVFILLNASRGIITSRLNQSNRGRKDDAEEVILERLKVFDKYTRPVMYLIEKQKEIPHVRIEQNYGSTTPDDVFRICTRKISELDI